MQLRRFYLLIVFTLSYTVGYTQCTSSWVVPACNPPLTGNATTPSGVLTGICLGESDSLEVLVTTIGNADSVNICWPFGTPQIQSFSSSVNGIFKRKIPYNADTCLIYQAPILVTWYQICNGFQTIVDQKGFTYTLYPTAQANFVTSDDSLCYPNGAVNFTQDCNLNILFDHHWDFGVTSVTSDTSNTSNPTFNYTPYGTGTYIVTHIVDHKFCSSVDTLLDTVTLSPPPNPVIQATDFSICPNTQTQLDADTGYVSYQWSANALSATTQTVNVSASGNYTVTVTNIYGCTASTDTAITVHIPPVVSINNIPNPCVGDTAQLTTNATLGVTYLWSNSLTTSSINVTSSGTYAVTVTDGNGCTAVDSFTVTFTTSFSPQIVSQPPGICGTQPAILSTATAYNGYQWSTAQTSATITVSTPGTYTVTVTDAGGCTGTNSFVVSSFSSAAAPVFAIAPNSFCEGDSALLSTAGIYNNYLWSTGDTTATAYVLAGGTYTVTVTDANGCTAFEDTIVVMRSNPPTGVPSTASFCSGDSVFISVNGDPGANYSWSQSLIGNNVYVSVGGNYTVTVTQPNGCSRQSTVQATEYIPPNVDISGVTAICQGDSAHLDAGVWNSYVWSTSFTGQILSTITTGIYTVTVTDGNGCTNSDTDTVNVSLNPVPGILSGTFPFCDNDSLLLHVNNSNYPVYMWGHTPLNTDSLYVNTAGWYIVHVVDSNGCKGADSLFVTTNAAPPFILGDTTHYCDESSVVLTAGPAGAYNYLWSSGETTNAITVYSPGWYTVTVTNGGTGCSSSGFETVIEDMKPVASINGPVSACVNDTITLVASQGNYIYTWLPGLTANDTLEVYTPGNYVVIIENSTACSDTDTVSIVFHPLPAYSILGDTVICDKDTAFFSLTSSYPGYLWTYSTGSSTSAMISALTAGIYTITVTDTNSCSATRSQLLTVNPLPTPTVTGDSIICDGDGTVLNAGFGNLTFLWSNSDTTATTYVYDPGLYAVTVTDVFGCTGNDNINVIVNPLPQFILEPNTPGPICFGNTITLITNPGGFVSYLWSDNSTLSSLNPTVSGNYSVLATDQNGCQNIAYYNLVVNPLPVPIIAGPDSSCEGEVEQLSCQTGFQNYEWTPQVSQLANINVTASGIYTVTVTDNNGCTADTAHEITFWALPVVQILGRTEFCENDSIMLSVNNPGCTYNWSNGSTSSITAALNGGFYQVTVTNVHGCSAGDIFLVTQYPNPQPSIVGDDTICAGFVSTLITEQYLYYSWSNFQTTSYINVNQTGVYQVTVVDTNGCEGTSDPFAVTVLDADTDISADGPLNLCPGEDVVLTANGGTIVLWSTGATTQSITVDTTSSIVVTVTNDNGCVVISAPVQINDRDNPTVTFSTIEKLNCENGWQVDFVNQSVCEPASIYSWHFGDGDTSDMIAPVHYYQQTGTYITELIITSPYGCISSDTMEIHAVYGLPAVADYSVSTDIESVIGPPVQFTSSSVNAEHLSWFLNDKSEESINDIESISHYFCEEGEHNTFLVAYNEDGCPDTLKKKIMISPFFIPDAFTPNKDFKNEYFPTFPSSYFIKEYHLTIYNRWGRIFFETTDPSERWDGTYHGKEAPEDIYIYIIRIINTGGCEVPVSGDGIDHVKKNYYGKLSLIR